MTEQKSEKTMVASGVMTGGSGGTVVPGYLCIGSAGTWIFIDSITILVGKFKDGEGKVIQK